MRQCIREANAFPFPPILMATYGRGASDLDAGSPGPITHGQLLQPSAVGQISPGSNATSDHRLDVF